MSETLIFNYFQYERFITTSRYHWLQQLLLNCCIYHCLWPYSGSGGVYRSGEIKPSAHYVLVVACVAQFSAPPKLFDQY